jgi:hypothetical protein
MRRSSEEEPMGQARREGEVWEQYAETRDMLLLMLQILRENPTLPVPELYTRAHTLLQEEESDEELQRKMEKDD